MSRKGIPVLDFDDLILALQDLAAPSATDVAVSNTNMHYITEDDAQGALAELDAECYALNNSLTQLEDDKFGTVVDLASYTSTKYVCVSDGFVVASCGARGDAKAIARVYDSTESNNFNIGGWGNNTYATFSCFVKKGMKLQAVTIENSGTIKFYPLNG